MSAHLLNLVDRIAAAFGSSTTTRIASEEFGRPFAARYRAELSQFSDAELLWLSNEEIVAAVLAVRARRQRQRNQRKVAEPVIDQMDPRLMHVPDVQPAVRGESRRADFDAVAYQYALPGGSSERP